MKFFLCFIPTKFEHSFRSTGRILLQVNFFKYVIPTKFEHSSRSTGRIMLQVKFFLYFIPTKFEHSSCSTGRILLQEKFFYILSQQNLSIAPAALGGYCFKWSSLNILSQQNIPTKCEHSSCSIDSTSHSKPPRSASMRLKKLPCTDKGRRRRCLCAMTMSEKANATCQPIICQYRLHSNNSVAYFLPIDIVMLFSDNES